jgi:hypothetical protein
VTDPGVVRCRAAITVADRVEARSAAPLVSRRERAQEA